MIDVLIMGLLLDPSTLDAPVIAAVLFLTIASMAGWLDDREPPLPPPHPATPKAPVRGRAD
jgi:hypothetical protein